MKQFLTDYKLYLSEPSRYAGLDWLRAIACLSVVMFHYMHLNSLGSVFYLGWMGVDLFFVLSGFLIGTILFSQMNKETTKFSYKSFIKNRFLRIYPLFLFVFVFSALIKGAMILSPEFWSAFGIHVVMGQTLYPLFGLQMNTNIFGVEGSWTLVIEWFFYMLSPLLIWMVIRLDHWKEHWGFGFLCALFFSGIFVRYIILQGYPADDYNWHFAVAVRPPGRYDVLVAGIIAAYLVFKNPMRSYEFLWPVCGMVLTTIISYLYLNPEYLFRADHMTREVIIYPLLAGIGFGSLLLCCMAVQYGPMIINILARLSYAMYLLHFLVIWASKTYEIPLNPVLYLSTVIGVSLLANLFIEYPCLRLYKKR